MIAPVLSEGRPSFKGFCFILLFLSVVLAQPAEIRAQETSPRPSESYSESVSRSRQPELKDPAEILRSARFIYVRSVSLLVTAEDIENKLRRHPDFQRYGMLITRQEADADLILEVRRSILTKFVFTAVDPKSLVVVASGKLSSLGGTVDGKVAKKFMKQLAAARQ